MGCAIIMTIIVIRTLLLLNSVTNIENATRPDILASKKPQRNLKMLNFIKSLFCKHKWEVVDTNIKPDYYTDDAGYVHNYTKKSILLKCTECGKIIRKVI